MKLWPRRGRRAAREQELNREIEWHLNEIAEEHEAAGLSPMQAVHAARRDFGNDALVREDLDDHLRTAHGAAGQRVRRLAQSFRALIHCGTRGHRAGRRPTVSGRE